MAEPPVDDLYRRYAAAGDLKALAAVFDALAPDLLRLARRLVRDHPRAEDLVQETFLTALEHPESYDPKQALQPWLIGILGASRFTRTRPRTSGSASSARSSARRPRSSSCSISAR